MPLALISVPDGATDGRLLPHCAQEEKGWKLSLFRRAAPTAANACDGNLLCCLLPPSPLSGHRLPIPPYTTHARRTPAAQRACTARGAFGSGAQGSAVARPSAYLTLLYAYLPCAGLKRHVLPMKACCFHYLCCAHRAHSAPPGAPLTLPTLAGHLALKNCGAADLPRRATKHLYTQASSHALHAPAALLCLHQADLKADPLMPQSSAISRNNVYHGATAYAWTFGDKSDM